MKKEVESDSNGTRSGASLFERMRQEGYRFDFYQAVRLLERRARTSGVRGRSGAAQPGVRFRPDPGLSFPAADVKRIDVPESPDAAPTVVATFMGLYGVDSPLPTYFYDRIAVYEESAAGLRDFLDIFAHRFYGFFYRAWQRVRPEVSDDEAHDRRFLAVAGLANAPSSGTSPLPPSMLVPLANRLSPRSRGADGLSGLLRTLLGLPVRIEQFVPRWVRVQRSPALGRGARLQGGQMLGDRVFDVSGKFRTWIGPMDLDHYVALLPGGPESRLLDAAVRAYVPGYLDFDVALQVRTERMTGVRLGDRQSRLGLTTSIRRPTAPIMTRIVRQAEVDSPVSQTRVRS